MKNSIFEKMETLIMNEKLEEADRQRILECMLQLEKKKLNILITGATGCGKSSTINALFDTEVAKVGVGADPETMDIEKYELNDNVTIWDSPGLGDGKEADSRHARNIINLLSKVDEDGSPLIDVALVIIDGSSRDMGTTYELIEKVLIPNLQDNRRILVAINQADIAMKGRGHWDEEKNCPKPELVTFLENKAQSVKERILEATGVTVEPIYYCAGYKEEGLPQARPYNLSKLLYYILQATPEEKRVFVAASANKDADMWRDDDGLKQYGEESRRSVTDALTGALAGGAAGAKVGTIIGGALGGPAGAAVGRVVGAVLGGICGLFGL